MATMPPFRDLFCTVGANVDMLCGPHWINAQIMSNQDSMNCLYIRRWAMEWLQQVKKFAPSGTYVFINGKLPIRGQYGEFYRKGIWHYARIIKVTYLGDILLTVARNEVSDKTYDIPMSHFQEYGTALLSTIPEDYHPVSNTLFQNTCTVLLNPGLAVVADALGYELLRYLRQYLVCPYNTGDHVSSGCNKGEVVLIRSSRVLLRTHTTEYKWVSVCSLSACA